MIESDILNGLTDLVGRRNLAQVEMDNWRAGAANGGPSGDGLYPMTDSTGFVRKLPSPAKVAEIAAGSVTPRFTGAAPALMRDWRSEEIKPQMFPDTDWAFSIQRALDCAWQEGASGITIPNTGGPYVMRYRGDPPGNAQHTEDKVRGIIKLRPNVHIQSDNAKLIIAPGDEVAMGRGGPPGIFYHNFYEHARCDNVRITGLIMDGNIENQTWINNHEDQSGSEAWQFTHAIAMMRGDNFEVDKCIFRGWRGDGIVIGNAFTRGQDTFLCRNARVHHNEFKDIYREGVLFCDVEGGEFNYNWVHGDGYLVAGVDIERHQVEETVRGIEVAGNLFDFRDGISPVERDGPYQPKYRRAVSIGFFYQSFGRDPVTGKRNPADRRSNGHRVHHNQIYQGGMDSWRHNDVEICDNHFESTYEDLTGVRLISAEAIRVFDFEATEGLSNIKIMNNTIRSDMDASPITVFNYDEVNISNNTIFGSRRPGIYAQYISGIIANNHIIDAGTPGNRCAAILMAANRPGGISVTNNIGRDLRSGEARGMIAVVEVTGGMTRAPMIAFNQAVNSYHPDGTPSYAPIKLGPEVGTFVTMFGNTNANGEPFAVYGSGKFGNGVDEVQLRLDGGPDKGKTFEFLSAGTQRWSFGTSTQVPETGGDTGSNFSFFARDDNANYKFNVFKVNRATKEKDFSDGSFRISGNWQEPFIMGPYTRYWSAGGVLYWNYNQPTSETDGTPVNYQPPIGSWQQPFSWAGSYVWFDPQGGVIRTNYGKPTSTSDGRAVGPQPGGTWDYPIPFGGMWLFGNPNDGKMYLKTGAKPTGPTDGKPVVFQS